MAVIWKLNVWMMLSEKANITLKNDLLRTFVAVVDAHSFTAASRHLNSTQSTVSQKVLRLENAVGAKLLDRSRQGVELTDSGEILLGYARRLLMLQDEAIAAMTNVAGQVTLRLGLPEDFASALITPALAEYIDRRPQVRLAVTSGLSRDLYRSYRKGELDLVLVKQRFGATKGALHWPEPLAWFENKMHPLSSADPVPLVAFPPGGLYRSEMIEALEKAGHHWRLVYSSSSLAGLQSAIAAGLGLSLLPRRVKLSTFREVDIFPNVAEMEIAIHYTDLGTPFLLELIELLSAIVEEE